MIINLSWLFHINFICQRIFSSDWPSLPASSRQPCSPNKPNNTTSTPSGRLASLPPGVLKKIPTEESSSSRTSKKSTNTTPTPPKPTKWVLLNLPLTLTPNSPPSSWLPRSMIQSGKMPILTCQASTVTLIGPPKVSSHQSRTKEIVVHAGLSALSPLSSHSPWWKDKPLLFPNNNWSTAQRNTEMMDATVDTITKVWPTSRTTVSPLVLLTHTSPRLKPASLMEDHSRFQESVLPRDAQVFWLLWLQDHWVFQSMPPTGLTTQAEFSTIARPVWTTTCFWSEPLTNTGRSRTHGEPHGVKTDSSDWQLETLAVSAWISHHGLFDRLILF